MKTQTLLRMGCVCIFIGAWTNVVFCQTPSPSPTPVQIIYTGKLLGYFRVPSLQESKALPGCPGKSAINSDAANAFLSERNPDPSTTTPPKNPLVKNAILVGTGDNFSPQLEARVFSNPPPPPQGIGYAVGNKELFVGHGPNWVFYDKVDSIPSLKDKINGGRGTIPTDNVACFLRAARFDAIVPGKHDFYFGPERIRQLARFLASPDPQSGLESVQMLGANLVMKTEAIKDSAPSSKVVSKHWFGDWPEDYPLVNVTDGATVYPWFSYVKFRLLELQLNQGSIDKLTAGFSSDGVMKSDKDFETLIESALIEVPRVDDELQKKRDTDALNTARATYAGLRAKPILLCASNGDPNDIPDNLTTCTALINRQIRLVGTTILFYVALPVKDENTGKNNHFSTLTPNKNYALCTDIKGNKGCTRFSVHNPFFYFPHKFPEEKTDGYTDPDPFVLRNENVAIFGVVDPDLGQQVGILNFGWRNANSLTTKLKVEDPVDALRQQLDYFDYYEQRRKKSFNGIKILLAQTTPQRAKAFAARFPEFQVVVSAADQEQGTSELELTTHWQPRARVGAFVAVPTPYFNSTSRKGSVHFGRIQASEVGNKWTLESSADRSKSIDEREDSADDFWKEVKELRGCLPSNFKKRDNDNPSKQEYLKWLVLCAMREKTAADVALIQKRDLYDKLPLLSVDEKRPQLLDRSKTPSKNGVDPRENFQQMLDRLIWKGDFLTLLYVPGSDLKKALDQSKRYEREETATLSPAAERGRALERLGITEGDGEYIINELPLDDNRIYAVATTDYVGAGDTGYPDLVKAALNPRTHPAAFDQPLVSISSLACQKLFLPGQATHYCLKPISAEEYLDTTTAERSKPYRQLGTLSRFWEASPFKWPGSSSLPKTIAGTVEQQVQRRPIWTFSLRKFSFSYGNLSNNLTKTEIEEKFSGVPDTQSVTSEESRTHNYDVATRLSRSSHEREMFVEWGFQYKRVSTGNDPDEFSLSQPANRMFSDIGFVWWRKPGRAAVNIGVSISLHAETPFRRQFSTFTLSTENSDKLRVDYGRSLTLMPRVGVRWQNRKNSFEVGFQGGREIDALRGFSFTTSGEPVECLASSGTTFAKCVSNNSDPDEGGLITPASQGTALYGYRPRAGVYWKAFLSVPIWPKYKLNYEFEDEFDYFFVRFHRDTSIDTKLRDISKHKISFSIIPSLSIGPSLQLLLFKNKRNHDFLIQRQFGIETTLSFDIFNRREKGVQVQHKP